jgi:23S rRNA pseudouridine2605 synthase
MKEGKNTPRFLDYRRNPLPLDVALSFHLPAGCEATARELILSQKVQVNDVIERSYHRLVCRHTDIIAIDGIIIQKCLPMPRYYLCYKPRGVICSNKRNEGIDRYDAVYISDWLNIAFQRNNASESVDIKMKTINTVGRLDEESEGLLLLTNDGSFSRLLCDPEFGLSKTYRVVAKGSGFDMLKSMCSNDAALVRQIKDMVENGNPLDADGKQSKSHICFESCQVLDVGRLASQHTSDDSYYTLLDLTLREGKTHAVRRIMRNSGLRVFYLSRIEIEGLDEFSIAKPSNLQEAEACGFIPNVKCKTIAKDGNVMLDNSGPTITLNPGYIIELKSCHVDKIFSLRTR